jgi:hypothetical protein
LVRLPVEPSYFTARDQSHFIMVSSSGEDDPKFNGSDWHALNRVIALAKFRFTQDDDYDGNEARRCAYLAEQYEGPALDWVASVSAATPATLENFDGFIRATRQAFGIAENNITALLRRELDQLAWRNDVPVFFAEFDRLTLALGITSHEVRIAMVEQKLPQPLKMRLAEQALSFANYDTMRERFNLMWAMDPTRAKTVTLGKKRPRCGTCGKKGHTAADCTADKTKTK